MKIFGIWPLMLVTLLFTACSETDDDPDNASNIDSFQSESLRLVPDQLPDASSTNILQSHHDYVFAEFQAHIPAEYNSIIAPFDWQQFMAMISLGAEGTTLDAFTTATRFNFNQTSVYEDISVWEQSITTSPAVNRASYLWGQSGYLFSLEYLQQQAELFGPQMNARDFLADPNQQQFDINGTLLTDYSLTNSKTRLVAAQTTHINSGWSSSLLAEEVVARLGSKYRQNWVGMVRLEGELNVYQASNYKAVQIPFESDGLALILITPNEGEFAAVSGNLNSDFWIQMIENMALEDTVVYVPKMNIDRELIEEDLPRLGVAGSESGANFSAVNNAGFLYIEQAYQNVSMAVSLSGINTVTKNIAVHKGMVNEPDSLFSGFVSIVDIILPSFFTNGHNGSCFYPPQQSPFIFAILDKATNSILHLGQVVYINGDRVESDWIVPYNTECGDEPPVEIYKYKGSVQCELNSGVGYWDMEQTLLAEGIEVLAAGEQSDNLGRIQVCGAADGVINVFSIRQSQLSEAQVLGFNLLSELPQ